MNDGKYYPPSGGYKGKNFAPREKVDLFNLKKELAEVKNDLNDIKQYFASEKVGTVLPFVEIQYMDGTRGEYKNVKIKKYTLEAEDKNGNPLIINKNAYKLMVVKQDA